MSWYEEDWIDRAYTQRKHLIEVVRQQSVEPVKGPSNRYYSPLTGQQAADVLTGWLQTRIRACTAEI